MNNILNAIVSVVALGITALCATFFILLNKYKKEIWDSIEFVEEKL